MTCTSRKLPLGEKQKVRLCGRPAIYLVGSDGRPRCKRCVALALRRGEKVVRIDGKVDRRLGA